jgi:hypothetical protein
VEPLLYRHYFDNTASSKSVCENFTDLNNPARGELVHKIFMDNVSDDTNQGTPSQGDSCAFPFFVNIGVPLMATLYTLGLNVGLPFWLGTIPNVLNSLDASQLSTLCHGNNVDVPSSTNAFPPPSSASGEGKVTSNQNSKRSRKRNNRKKKSPTYASHVGDRSITSTIHVEDQQPTYASHVEEKSLVTASHTSNISVASVSHVIDPSPTSASHVGDMQPTTANHVGGIGSIDKPKWIGCNPKFPCKLCKGDHHIHLCPDILEI